jgi:hypothetical protein
MERLQDEAPRYVSAVLRQFTTGATTDADLPADWTVEEATREISLALGLPRVDAENRPQHYELFVEHADGAAEKLNGTAIVGDVVRNGDEVKPLPAVTPGHPGAPRGRSA